MTRRRTAPLAALVALLLGASSLIAAALLFLLATIPMARFTDYVSRKDRERRLQRTV